MLFGISNSFREVAEQCIIFMNTLQNNGYNEQENSPELFLMSLINLSVENAKSISLLLDNNQYGSVILICRNIMEAFFNFHWAMEIIGETEVKEKVSLLEGDTFYRLDNYVKYHEKDLGSIIHVMDKLIFKQIKNIIEAKKTNSPQLLTKDKQNKPVFKHLPPFDQRMGEHRFKYYKDYIFMSLFCHPTPNLKPFYLPTIVDENNNNSIEEILKVFLCESMYFIQAIMGYANHAFNNINTDNIATRNNCLKEIERVFNRISDGIVVFNDETT